MFCRGFGILSCDHHVRRAGKVYGKEDLLMMEILSAIVFIQHRMFVRVDKIGMEFEVMVDILFGFVV